MPNLNAILVSESGRIGPDIHEKVLNTSPWLKLVQRGEWPDEMGQQISTMTYERSLPSSTVTWNDVTANAGSGNTCVPSAHTINIAQTLRNYNLQQTALEGPNLCVNDLRYNFQRQKQLGKMFDVLAQNTGYLWQERYRDEYVRLSSYKTIARSGFPTSSASFPLQVATSRLTQGMLDKFYLQLVRDGAGRKAIEMVDGRPQFMALMSPEAQDGVFRDNNDLTGIRTDFNYSTRANELLAPLGIQRAYKGWIHMIDDFPPRYNFTAGAWVRVAPYVSEATTQGNRYIVNSAYESALYEDTILFHRDVFTCLIPKPITNPGGNTKFNPVNYMGEWAWKNIPDRVENPDENWGYFRGVFMSGSEPVHPEWGIVLRHLRIDPSNSLLSES